MDDANELRIWRSGDDLLVALSGFSFELSRDAALALAAEISGCYATPSPERWAAPAERRAEICRLYQSGLGVSELSRRSGVSKQGIYGMLARAGIAVRDQKQSARAKKMHARRRAA